MTSMSAEKHSSSQKVVHFHVHYQLKWPFVKKTTNQKKYILQKVKSNANSKVCGSELGSLIHSGMLIFLKISFPQPIIPSHGAL